MVGCNTELKGELVLVAHEDQKDYMAGLWRDYCPRRVISYGVLLSDRERSSIFICGAKGRFVTCYCLPCARKHGFIW